ncbi:MAG: polysaccharide deacetylase family protein, partial [Paludibacteraceae bacterium]|nr:polysaccharide deacetylase family protein [Paludibacteraceae bacterium]
MFIERPFILLKSYYKGALWRIKSDEKTVYVTFDDGPDPDVTPKVLDILDQYGVKAT